jgi:hypothetical protein
VESHQRRPWAEEVTRRMAMRREGGHPSREERVDGRQVDDTGDDGEVTERRSSSGVREGTSVSLQGSLVLRPGASGRRAVSSKGRSWAPEGSTARVATGTAPHGQKSTTEPSRQVDFCEGKWTS